MNKIFILLILSAFELSVSAQTRYVSSRTHAFGVIDTADLKMTECNFEKDANDEILFDKAEVKGEFNSVTMLRQTRMKIFTQKGESAANVRIPYFDDNDNISDIEAETINLVNNVIEHIPVDKKLIYKEKTNKYIKTIVFTFPSVKPGSVLELKYKWQTFNPYNFPSWFFQSIYPTRYSEFLFNPEDGRSANFKWHITQPLALDSNIYNNNIDRNDGTSHIWGLTNINSLKKEPYMDLSEDNLQYIRFFNFHSSDLTSMVEALLKEANFGKQLNKPSIINSKLLDSLDGLKEDDLKIAYIFNMVKNTMGWNGINYYATQDGVEKAWGKKLGNSTEINLILYNALKQAGIKCNLILLSTRDHGLVDFTDIYFSSFNKAVVYIPTTTEKNYILDATYKYNTYNDIPIDLLNLKAIVFDEFTGKVNIATTMNNEPAKQTVYIDAEIKPNGTIEGTSTITSYSYNKAKALKSYELAGKEKYIDSLTDGDNNLKIISLEQENADVDSLPLIQDINFKLNLEGSDDKYIYFNPNLFTSLRTNPFLSETRHSDIDFLYCSYYKISGNYKIPPGYTVDAIPKDITLKTQDNSITFSRIVGQQDGIIQVKYNISFKKSRYKQYEYPGLYQFYKKMFEMLNEQIVLKKS